VRAQAPTLASTRRWISMTCPSPFKITESHGALLAEQLRPRILSTDGRPASPLPADLDRIWQSIVDYAEKARWHAPLRLLHRQ